jgi:riboflavin kinase/FMN adenylyltransferase
MKVVFDTDKNEEAKSSVVTIGTFDGVHIGHKVIIEKLKEQAKKLNCESVVITFFPHPRVVVNNDSKILLLTTLEEKKELIEKLGVDKLYIINFTKDFAKKTYQEFLTETIIKKNKAKYIIIGYDHKFGKDRAGDKSNLMELTKNNNIDITVVNPQEIEGIVVSSTKIRNALLDGNLDLANKMLGRNYKVNGTVVEGSKRGRTLGFPTANIEPSEKNKLLPQNGVYLVEVILNNQKYFGVLNIGLRPTFNNRVEPIAEVYLLDFNEDIYGKEISIEFIKRLRDEKKFQSKEELITQIKKDIKEVRKILNK